MLIHQVPQSSFTNFIDLGVWCNLQAIVDITHYNKRSNVYLLLKSVETAWKEDKVGKVINKVWGHLKNVMVLLVEAKSANNLVEKKRGKKI